MGSNCSPLYCTNPLYRPLYRPSRQIAPTMDEAKALKMYRGPPSELSPPERFLLVMASVPRLVSKARVRVAVGCWGMAVGGGVLYSCKPAKGSRHCSPPVLPSVSVSVDASFVVNLLCCLLSFYSFVLPLMFTF